MTPDFSVDGGLPVAAARFLSVAGLTASFGTLLYLAWVAPPGLSRPLTGKLRRVAWGGLTLAGAGALLWLAAQTADLAGDFSPASLAKVLGATLFGHLVLACLTCLALASAAFCRGSDRLAAALAGLALALQAAHGHAMAMGGARAMLAVSVLHLLAAGAWLGGLVPLLVVVREAPAAIALRAARRFSPLGMVCVATLLVTAALQFRAWIGDLPGLLGTAYGWMAGLKMLVFACLIGLAARNRLVHTPALANSNRAGLLRAIAIETASGLAILLAAAVLSQLPPSMHVQKIWPFAWAPSLDALREDADYAQEAAATALAMAAAFGLLLRASISWPRWRLAAGPAALAVLFLAAPHFGPLLVPATPTRYFRSPTGFSADSILRGATLYPARCAVCHGNTGHGDGPAAKNLPVPPADLTAPHLWAHADGELFWWISHGMQAPDGKPAMPGFSSLSNDDVWALIDLLRARNGGLTLDAEGGWGHRLRAPDFPLLCTDPAGDMLSDLDGHARRIVFGPGAAASPGLITVAIGGNAPPSPGLCTADDPGVAEAYAIATGRPHGSLEGANILIDSAGWLRVLRPAPGWTDQPSLAKAVDSMASHALPPSDDSMPMNMKM